LIGNEIYFCGRACMRRTIFKAIALVCTVTIGAVVTQDLWKSKAALAGELGLPVPTAQVLVSQAYEPLALAGYHYDAKDPESLELLYRGDLSQAKAAQGLADMFVSALALPVSSLWVNLSPSEKDRIIEPSVRESSLAKILLDQDYLLKQLASSLTNPNTELGKAYWAERASTGSATKTSEEFKVWIMPKNVAIAADATTAMIMDATLTVLSDRAKRTGETETPAVKAILSAIEKDVNTGKNFASLRQMYRAVVLSNYLKETKSGILGAYADSQDLTQRAKTSKDRAEKVFGLYKTAFEKGAYDLTKEKRRYVSGGIIFEKSASAVVLPLAASSVADGTVLRQKISAKDIGRGLRSVVLAGLLGYGAADADVTYKEFPDSASSAYAKYMKTFRAAENVDSINAVLAEMDKDERPNKLYIDTLAVTTRSLIAQGKHGNVGAVASVLGICGITSLRSTDAIMALLAENSPNVPASEGYQNEEMWGRFAMAMGWNAKLGYAKGIEVGQSRALSFLRGKINDALDGKLAVSEFSMRTLAVALGRASRAGDSISEALFKRMEASPFFTGDNASYAIALTTGRSEMAANTSTLPLVWNLLPAKPRQDTLLFAAANDPKYPVDSTTQLWAIRMLAYDQVYDANENLVKVTPAQDSARLDLLKKLNPSLGGAAAKTLSTASVTAVLTPLQIAAQEAFEVISARLAPALIDVVPTAYNDIITAAKNKPVVYTTAAQFKAINALTDTAYKSKDSTSMVALKIIINDSASYSADINSTARAAYADIKARQTPALIDTLPFAYADIVTAAKNKPAIYTLSAQLKSIAKMTDTAFKKNDSTSMRVLKEVIADSASYDAEVLVTSRTALATLKARNGTVGIEDKPAIKNFMRSRGMVNGNRIDVGGAMPFDATIEISDIMGRVTKVQIRKGERSVQTHFARGVYQWIMIGPDGNPVSEEALRKAGLSLGKLEAPAVSSSYAEGTDKAAENGGIDLTMGQKSSGAVAVKQGEFALEIKIKSLQKTTMHKYLKTVGVS